MKTLKSRCHHPAIACFRSGARVRAFWWLSLILLLLLAPWPVGMNPAIYAQVPRPPVPPALAPSGPLVAPNGPVVSAASYAATLEGVAKQLARQRKQQPSQLSAALAPLTTPRRVRRGDGATLFVGPDLWLRLQPALPTAKSPGLDAATAQEWSRAEGVVGAQLKALRAWSTPVNGSYFTAVDAKAMVTQLEKTGQIVTQPSEWERRTEEIFEVIKNAWEAMMNWLKNLFPPPVSPQVPSWNMRWFWMAFWGLLVGVLLLLAWYLYRTLGSRLDRSRQRKDEWTASEDAELLLLPPDELRARARAFAAEGNYPQALRHRYISLLLTLDERQIWRYDIRRTNWEHIAGLRKNPAHRAFIAPLSQLTRTFDRVRYGDADCSEQDWLAFEAATDTLEGRNNVAPVPAGGAS